MHIERPVAELLVYGAQPCEVGRGRPAVAVEQVRQGVLVNLHTVMLPAAGRGEYGRGAVKNGVGTSGYGVGTPGHTPAVLRRSAGGEVGGIGPRP
ncbi:hypothetical protein GCM10009802_07290 [Streptomyces synnematoformans]|uniref:Uncharacterized protein n=1 Tax=Streptomyces synnematoformans TaxID=415721 RepID=A0ABP5J4C2_9ACTN